MRAAFALGGVSVAEAERMIRRPTITDCQQVEITFLPTASSDIQLPE